MDIHEANIYEADIEIEIERLVFRGMNLSPERAERIKGKMEEELQRMMGQIGIMDDFLGQEVSQQGVSQTEGIGFQISTVADDERLAKELATSIFRSIGKMR